MSNKSLTNISPIHLLSGRRLDLVVKYLYFRNLIEDSRQKEIEALYEKHILLRTGGCEPIDNFGSFQSKNSVLEYKSAAANLLESLKINGFNKEHPIPYFTDGLLGNGAHRLSASLALDLNVWAEHNVGAGTAWDFNWFVNHGFAKEELQRILLTYSKLKSESLAIFLLFQPSNAYWTKIESRISEVLNIVGAITLDFESAQNIYNLCHDLYRTLDDISEFSSINRKAYILAAMNCFSIRVVLAEKKNETDSIHQIANQIKIKCRSLAHPTIDKDLFITLHASSDAQEFHYMASVLLSANNISHLMQRSSAVLRTEFLTWLKELRKVCALNEIPLEKICIVGSSPLEIMSIRDSTDIDITLTSDIRQRFGAGVSKLGKNVDIVTEGYHRSESNRWISDDELILDVRNHFIFRGFKFANPQIVLDRKNYSKREKDIKDLELATVALEKRVKTQDLPFFNYLCNVEKQIRLREMEDPLQRSNKTFLWKHLFNRKLG